jgi:hypothetical protein
MLITFSADRHKMRGLEAFRLFNKAFITFVTTLCTFVVKSFFNRKGIEGYAKGAQRKYSDCLIFAISAVFFCTWYC